MESDLNMVEPKIEEEIINEEGADLGTFKSVKNLKDAYDSLRKVFTQKSMELAKLKKEENNTINVENITEDKKEKLSDKEEITPDASEADKEQSPAKIWENQEWSQNVKSFFENNERAKDYIKEIGQVLVQDKELSKRENPLQLAWIKVLEDKINENTVNNKDLEKIVMENEELKQKIILEYLSNLNNKKVSPLVIGKNIGAEIRAEVPKKAQSIEEAKELAKKILIK